MIETGSFLETIEAFGRALAGDERPVTLVDVAGDELGAFGVGAGDDDGRHATHVGGKASGIQVADGRLAGDEHLAAEVAALLFAGELVLEVNAGRARFDHRPS